MLFKVSFEANTISFASNAANYGGALHVNDETNSDAWLW